MLIIRFTIQVHFQVSLTFHVDLILITPICRGVVA